MEFSIDELYDIVPNVRPPVEVDVGTIYKSKTIDAYLTSTINDLNKEYTKLQASLKDFSTIKNIHITKIHKSSYTFTNNLKNAQSILSKMIDINNIINSITRYTELEKQLECDRIYSSESTEPTTEDYGEILRSHAEFAAYSKNPFPYYEYKPAEPVKGAVIQFDDLSQVQQHEEYEKLHEDFCKKEMLSTDSEDESISDTRTATCNNSNCVACRQNTGPCPALNFNKASTFGLMPIHLE